MLILVILREESEVYILAGCAAVSYMMDLDAPSLVTKFKDNTTYSNFVLPHSCTRRLNDVWPVSLWNGSLHYVKLWLLKIL